MNMQLRSVEDGKVVGTVVYDGSGLTFTGAAESVFAELRRILGDQKLGDDLATNGWSNGWLYITHDGGGP